MASLLERFILFLMQDFEWGLGKIQHKNKGDGLDLSKISKLQPPKDVW